MGHESIMFEDVVITNELGMVTADICTLSCWITICASSQIYIGIHISSDQIKDKTKAATTSLAKLTSSTAACFFMTSQQFQYEGWNLEKSI